MKAFFIDGKTSKRRSCDLVFDTGNIEINYLGDDENQQQAIWDIDRIRKIDVRTSSNALKYGDFPHEALELASGRDFDLIIERYPEASFHQSTYNKFAALGWKGLVFAVAAVVAVSLLFFFYGAPALAEGFARTIPEEYETYIGENLQETYLQYQEIDTIKSEQIQRFFKELHYQSEYDISIVVVDSDIVNAFALPGGFIVVYSGILDIMEDDGELAALLAHEVSHINGRHSLRTMSRNLSTYLLLSILTGDVGGFSSVLIENSSLISSLSFSRNLEKDADLDGLKLMTNARIDPIGMVELFRRFEDVEDLFKDDLKEQLVPDSTSLNVDQDTTETWKSVAWQKTAELLSTHPSPNNRIEYLEEKIQKVDRKGFMNSDSLDELFHKIRDARNSQLIVL